MMKHRFPIACVLLLAFNFACETMHSNPNLQLMSRDQTEEAVDNFTVNKKIYDGFMNRLDVSATLQNSKVTSALIDESARVYQWSEEQYAKEKARKFEENGKATEMFLSFFVPERKEDDLNKGTTKWKLFLDVNGKRYEGKAAKIKTQFSELMVLYPHHTRWGTPYKLTFDVPVAEVENHASKLTITGPPGSTALEFSIVR